MQTLREKLLETSDFLLGVELVSIRGSMAERSAVKARDFANQLVACPPIDWISITDNAGGNPQLAPQALGKPILYAGKEVVIHLTCKDLNRNGLESEAWLLNSEGFHNILAMTGDYPVAGNGGLAKPVFDIDSVGLISMLDQMNQGFDPTETRGNERNLQLEQTQFLHRRGHDQLQAPARVKWCRNTSSSAKRRSAARDSSSTRSGSIPEKRSELRVYMDRARHELTSL